MSRVKDQQVPKVANPNSPGDKVSKGTPTYQPHDPLKVHQANNPQVKEPSPSSDQTATKLTYLS